MVKISAELLDSLFAILNSYMGLIQFGGEYMKVRKFLMSLYEENPNIDFSKYYWIKRELQEFKKQIAS